MTSLDHILVFKTDLRTEADCAAVRAVLDPHPLVERWSVDLEDADAVLRVVSRHLPAEAIPRLLAPCRCTCEALPD